MINSVYNTVNTISNKEQRGTISPERFNYLANMAIIDIYNDYDIAKYSNKANRGFINKGLNDFEKMERERYEHFYTNSNIALTVGRYNLPTDCNYIESMYYLDKELEECKSARQFHLLKASEDFKSTLEYPIYLKTGSTINVFPTEITGELSLFYIRQPLVPKWTYTMVGTVPLYNPSALDFQDIDLPQSEEASVTINILSQLGINLKEPELTQYAELVKDKNVSQENKI